MKKRTCKRCSEQNKVNECTEKGIFRVCGRFVNKKSIFIIKSCTLS